MIENGAIQAEGVHKVFGSGHQKVVALDDVCLTLNHGELTLLMGPSGSGKSSLLAALGGLQAPSRGEVLFRNKKLWRMSDVEVDRFRRDFCGFVFQSGGLFPSLTALDQLSIPLTYFGHSKAKANSIAKRMLSSVGLGERLDSRPDEMSGGENQRVSIARMLSKDPKLIFCDEPTSALDAENGAIVAKLLQEEARSRQAMILCVTHDDRLRPFADRILEISDGRIVSDSLTSND